MKHITVDKYFDCLLTKNPQYKKQLNDVIRYNAAILCLQVNQLFYEIDGKVILPNPIIVTSGWRPLEYNAMIGGAKNSYHCKAMAVDIQDKGNILSNYLLNNQEYLEKYNLRMEHPESTFGWCHLDIGKLIHNRVFSVGFSEKHKPIKNKILEKKSVIKFGFLYELWDDLIDFFIR